jgi:hypothetical protein
MPCLLAFFIGCMSCHLLRFHAGLGTVISAALAGFAGTFIPLPSRSDKGEIRAVLYAGAFAGMASPNVIGTPIQVPVISLVGALFYIALTPYFQGIGGKLGACAFATTATFLIAKTLS